jgi:RND family efflux transporter MFP subunit
MENKRMTTALRSILLISTSFAFVACGPPAGKTEAAAVEISVPVQGRVLDLSDFKETYNSIGRVTSDQQVNLIFEASGKVQEIFVEVGDSVVTGQPLARIKADVYSSAYAQARSMFEKAERDLASSQKLFNDNIISSDQFEMARIGLDNARAGYTQAKTMLDNTVLKAPFTGHIVTKNLNIGDLASPAAAMMPPFVLADMNLLKVVIPVPEARIGMVQQGMLADLTFKSLPDHVFSGIVRRVGLAPMDMSNNYDVEIFIDDPDHQLRLGMVADVQLILKEYSQVPVVPLRMVQDDGESPFVFVIQGNRAHRVSVEVMGMSGSSVHLAGDLSQGDTLISRGQNDVSEGALLDVVEVLGN